MYVSRNEQLLCRGVAKDVELLPNLLVEFGPTS